MITGIQHGNNHTYNILDSCTISQVLRIKCTAIISVLCLEQWHHVYDLNAYVYDLSANVYNLSAYVYDLDAYVYYLIAYVYDLNAYVYDLIAYVYDLNA